MLGMVDFVANPGVSERQKQNKFYQLRAMNVLGLADDPEEYRWLWNLNAKTQSAKVRHTILAELGCIEDAESERRIHL